MMLDDGTGSEFFFVKYVFISSRSTEKHPNMKEKLCANHFPQGPTLVFTHARRPVFVIDMDRHGYIWVNYLVGG